MASYEERSNEEEQATQIKFRFCKNCANLLYPTENRESSKLLFQCRHCNLTEPSETHCVFRNDLTNTVGETAGITQDVGSDPTVGDESCPVPPMCTMCGEAIVCEDCGKAQEDGFLCLEVDEDEPMPDIPEAESEENHRHANGTDGKRS